MVHLGDNFAVLTDCLRATGPALAVSTILSVATGISLAELKRRLPQSRVVNGLIATHFLPLLIPPVLLVAVLHLTLETAHFTDLAQSTFMLALFGYLFHAGITLALLSLVFHWNERVDTFRRLILNLPKRRIIWVGLFLTKIAPVVTFCLAATMILEESMITAPFFTTRQTVVSVVLDLSRLTSGDAASSLPLILTVLVAFATMLLFSYWIPILCGRSLLQSVARSKPQADFQRIDNLRTRQWSVYLASLLPICSSLLIFSSSVLALTQLVWQGKGASLMRSASLLSTLISLSIWLGITSFLVIILRTIVGFRSGRVERKAFDPLAPLALLPPALIGTVGLALTVGPISEATILAVSLGGYAYLMMSLVLNPASLRRDRLLFRNALKCQLRIRQLSMVVLASRLGGSLPLALLGLYMLWIEDGIQVTIGGHSDNLAYAVRGLKNGLQTHIYKGALITFAVWFVLAGLSMFLTSRRYRFISEALQKKYSVLVVCLVLVFIGVPSKITLAQTASRGQHGKSCTVSIKNLDEQKGNTLRLPACDSIVIPSLEMTTGALHLQVQHSTVSLHINSLSFRSERPTLYIEGTSPSDTLELTIDSVDDAPNATLSELVFQKVRLTRFAITGSLGKHSSAVLPGDTSIMFLPTATVQDFHLHSLAASALDIILPKGLKSSVHIDGLKGRSIYIHADEATGSENSPVTKPNDRHISMSAEGDRQRAILQELTLTDLDLEATTIEPARLSLKGITIGNAQVNFGANNLVQLRFQDLQIPSGTASNFEANSLGPDSRFSVSGEGLGLDGTLAIRAGSNVPLESVLFDTVQSATPSADSTLDITVPELGSVTLNDLAVSHLLLCGALTPSELDFQVKHVSVTDDISVPPAIVSRAWKPKYEAAERLSFLHLLQERGVYCDAPHAPISLDALYFRKKMELGAVHPVLAIVIEHLTGFGIKLFEAVETFFALLCLHFALRFIIVMMPITKSRLQIALVREAFFRSLAGTFTMREHGVHTPSKAALLETVRLCFGWIIFIQVTLCSIYLGQTTLQ